MGYTARPRPATTSYDSDKGIYLVKPGYDATVMMMTMKMCPLTIRILPVRSWIDGDETFDNFLDPSFEQTGFGSWFFTGPIVDRIGTWPSQATFLLPVETDTATLAASPVNALVRRCGYYAAEAYKSKDKDPHEYRFLVNKREKDSKDIPPLKAVSNGEIVACMVLEKEGKALPKIMGADGKPVFLVLPKSAGVALKAQFRAELKNNPNFDPIAFDQGCLVTFFEEGKDPRNRGHVSETAAEEPADMDAAIEQQQSSGDSGGPAFAGRKYSCFISQTYNRIGARITKAKPIFEQSLRSWPEMLYFMPFEQQAQLLAELFPPPLVLEALSTHPEWITDALRQSAAQYRTQGGTVDHDPPPRQTQVPSPPQQQSAYGNQPPAPPRAPAPAPSVPVYEREKSVTPPLPPLPPVLGAVVSPAAAPAMPQLTPEQWAYFNQLHGMAGQTISGPLPSLGVGAVTGVGNSASLPPMPPPPPMARPIPQDTAPFGNDSPAIAGTHTPSPMNLPPPPAIAGVFSEEQLQRAVMEIRAKTAASAAAE